MHSIEKDTKAATAGGGKPPSSRYEALPRYQQWQNAMRPEDTGRSDGLAGVPAQTDVASHFEGQVRDYLNSRLGRTRNEFASDDANFSAAISVLRPDYEHFKKLLDEKRSLGRPLTLILKRSYGWAGIAAATALPFALMFVLWNDKGIQPLLSAAISICSSVLASLAAYVFGLVFRQATLKWSRWLSVAALTILSGVFLVAIVNMNTPNFEVMERGVFGVMIAFAFLTVAACAFLMHDQDAAYECLSRDVKKLQPRLSQLEVQRIENRVFHTNVARRHVEIARRMITSYRHANMRSRHEASSFPSFFGEVPQLPEIADNWLDYLETK